MASRKPLTEWEMEKGIELRKRRFKYNTFTEREYKNLIRKNYITIKTEKGLKYLEEEVK